MGGMALRTIDVKADENSLIKPGELVDTIEVTPLTLVDRRIYNQLLANAWDTIDRGIVHEIAKRELRGSHNAYDRVGESVERLMGAIVKIRVEQPDGSFDIERVQLLGANVEQEKEDGILRYEFPAKLRGFIKNSEIFARIQKEVMFELTSKYSLALYEMVQKRGNLQFKSDDVFSIEEIRGLLGIPEKKLLKWGNLNQRALQPACKEVSALSQYEVAFEPIKKGRSFTHVRMRWWKKDSDGLLDTATELGRSRVGRKARIDGTVERLEVPNTLTPSPLKPETIETARDMVRPYGLDIYALERDWQIWSAEREPAKNADAAFLGWLKSHLERNSYARYG